MKHKTFLKTAAVSLSMTLICGLLSGYTGYSGSKCSAAAALAEFTFSQSDGISTAKDLNDTYKTKADTGYSAKSGKFSSSSQLFASVNSPSDSSYRKLEWSKDSDYTYSGSAQKATPIMTASSKNPWGTAPFFLIKTSTKGYTDISFSLRIGGTKKGPKEYKLQYSVNGTDFANIDDTQMSLSTNKTLYSFDFSLPELVSDKSTVYFKVVASSTKTIEGKSLSDDTGSGEAAINNVSISGTEVVIKPTAAPTAKPTSKPTTKPADSPNAADNPSSGDGNATAAPNSQTSTKALKTPQLTAYKRGTKYIKGKAVKKSTVTVTVGKKKYSATASKKGIFKVTLSRKLKKGNVIKVSAIKSGYTTSKTKTYKVK